jgi:hypothetical protein
LVCEWLTIDLYNRRYRTGIFSKCTYSNPDIVVQAPYGSLPYQDANGDRIQYQLKIRELDIINTQFFMPTTSVNE